MSSSPIQADLKFILVHLNPLSARLHFLVSNEADQATACLPEALDPLATLDISHETLPPAPHTALPLNELAHQIGLDVNHLELVTPLLAWVETPKNLTAIALVKLATQEPPALTIESKYITLMELLQVPVIDRLLFKKAYETLIGD